MIKWSKYPLSAKGFTIQSFFQFIFSSINKNAWKKKPMGNFFKLNALKEKRSFLMEKETK